MMEKARETGRCRPHLVVEGLPGAIVVGRPAHGSVGHGEAAEAGVVEIAERVGGDLRHKLLHHGGAASAFRGRVLRLLLVLAAHGHLAVGGPSAAAAGALLLLRGGGAEDPEGADDAADSGGPGGDQGPDTVHADIPVVAAVAEEGFSSLDGILGLCTGRGRRDGE
jgi:hypothetical protein